MIKTIPAYGWIKRLFFATENKRKKEGKKGKAQHQFTSVD